MNDPPQIINQPPPQPQMMAQGPMPSQAPPPQVIMNPSIPLPPPMMPVSQPQLMGQSLPMFGQSQQPAMNRNYNPNPNKKFHKPGFGRGNWKGKKPNDMRMDSRMAPNPIANTGVLGVPAAGIGGGYQPPTLNELQSQNRLKARKFYPKKKFNSRFAPYAPRNTTSFIMRAKKSGGITSLVSPCPVTPSVIQTPIFSPSREVLGDMAKEKWGVDGYGSMKGLIRLRNEVDNRENDEEEVDDDENEDDNGSSESDVEEEKNSVLNRLHHEMSRFEMVYPNYGVEYNNNLENRVDDQDTHIAQLEEENLTLKERLFLMERELGDLRRRLVSLERQNRPGGDTNEEVVENGSDNESEGGSDIRGLAGESKEAVAGFVDATAGAVPNILVADDIDETDIEYKRANDAPMVDFAANDDGVGSVAKVQDNAGDENLDREVNEDLMDMSGVKEATAQDSREEGPNKSQYEKSIDDGDEC